MELKCCPHLELRVSRAVSEILTPRFLGATSPCPLPASDILSALMSTLQLQPYLRDVIQALFSSLSLVISALLLIPTSFLSSAVPVPPPNPPPCPSCLPGILRDVSQAPLTQRAKPELLIPQTRSPASVAQP